MKRIVFLDYLRVFAIFLVMLVHTCECFYFGDDGGVYIASISDARWLTAIDSFCRASVPLFVMASAYLLFPVTRPTGDFLKRRLWRVGVPFLIWELLYNWKFDGAWGNLLFNFPNGTGGHLWFVPMILGLYLAMPLLSPWAERASEKEVRGYLLIWLFTTTFPFLRHLWGFLYGAPPFGATPYLYGECAWNSFGTFQYVSGFLGYMLLGFYFRKFVPALSWRRTLTLALPLIAVGWALVWSFFFYRIPSEYGYPVSAPYAEAVNLEMSWEFCSTGVLMTVVGYFLLLRKCTFDGALYRVLVRPLSAASFGIYLIHIFILIEVIAYLKPRCATPVTILAGGAVVFAFAALLVRAYQFSVNKILRKEQ